MQIARASLWLTMLIALSLYSQAADKKQLQAAVSAVDAKLKTPEGKRYDAQFGSEFSQKYAATVHQCKQAGQGTVSDFDLLVRLMSDGSVSEVLVYPETAFANCTRNGLANGKFSSPPHDDYWVNLHLLFKK